MERKRERRRKRQNGKEKERERTDIKKNLYKQELSEREKNA